MQTILVTGSNGLLGQKLTDKLRLNTSYQLINTSKGNDRYPVKEGYTYENLDITDAIAVETIVKKYQPQVIINTAAMTNVDACESDKETCWKLNVDGLQNLLTTIRQLPTANCQLIHLSTDFIFDGKNGPYKENDEPNPLSYYGQSKWEAEKLLINSDYKNWTILRTIIVYGVAAKMSRNNIVLWAKSTLEKGEKINVVDDQFRMPTLAEDLADACILVIEKNGKGIYHTSGKDFMSVLEMVYRIADFFGLDKSLVNTVSSSSLNQPAKRPPRTGFILDKAITELGYHPHSFEEGLAIVNKQLTTNS